MLGTRSRHAFSGGVLRAGFGRLIFDFIKQPFSVQVVLCASLRPFPFPLPYYRLLSSNHAPPSHRDTEHHLHPHRRHQNDHSMQPPSSPPTSSPSPPPHILPPFPLLFPSPFCQSYNDKIPSLATISTIFLLPLSHNWHILTVTCRENC